MNTRLAASPGLLAIALLALSPLASAQLDTIPLPEGFSGPLAAKVGPAGAVWVGVDRPPALLRYDPATGEWEPFRLPAFPTSEADSPLARGVGGRFWGLDVDALGRPWVADAQQGTIFLLDPAKGEATRIELGARNVTPLGLVIARDGGVWVAELLSHRLARVDPVTYEVEHHAIPGPRAGPLLLALGPDGNVWVTSTYAGRVAAIDPETREWVATRAGAVALDAPYGLAFAGGQVHVAQHGTNLLTSVNLTDGSWTDAAFVADPAFPGAEPGGIAPHPDGRSLWIAVHTANRVARFDLADGTSAEWELPGEGFANTVLVDADRDGAAWFTLPVHDRLGRLPANASAPVKLWIEPTAVLRPGENVTVRVSITPGSSTPLHLAATRPLGETGLEVGFVAGTTRPGAREATLYVSASPNLQPGRYPIVACAETDGVLACAREVASVRPREDSGADTPGLSALAGVLGLLAAAVTIPRRARGDPRDR